MTGWMNATKFWVFSLKMLQSLMLLCWGEIWFGHWRLPLPSKSCLCNAALYVLQSLAKCEQRIELYTYNNESVTSSINISDSTLVGATHAHIVTSPEPLNVSIDLHCVVNSLYLHPQVFPDCSFANGKISALSRALFTCPDGVFLHQGKEIVTSTLYVFLNPLLFYFCSLSEWFILIYLPNDGTLMLCPFGFNDSAAADTQLPNSFVLWKLAQHSFNSKMLYFVKPFNLKLKIYTSVLRIF